MQTPCIGRNALAAAKAIDAARPALHGDGTHKVSLDQVISTMRETGAGRQSKYEEASRGALAVNVIACRSRAPGIRHTPKTGHPPGNPRETSEPHHGNPGWIASLSAQRAPVLLRAGPGPVATTAIPSPESRTA